MDSCALRRKLLHRPHLLQRKLPLLQLDMNQNNRQEEEEMGIIFDRR